MNMHTRASRFLILLHLFQYCNNQGIPDNRCYLENGASSESFFVREDLAIGSTIGLVRVHGDPRPSNLGGNIILRLQKDVDSPIMISSGTKNLTLRRRLDKEGVDGPNSVFTNLICERLHTTDPGFVIPVNIRVTDANDNAPVFINAPYFLNISEVTVVGTRVLQGVHATDADQPGPFSSVRYSVLADRPHSDYFRFENELEGTLVLQKPLDFELLRRFEVFIRAQDHGEPPQSTDTVLTVNVVDADDQNPRFLDDAYTSTIPKGSMKGTVLVIRPRDIKAVDQDLGINAPIYYSFNGLGKEYDLFKLHKKTGQVSISETVNDGQLETISTTLVIKATQEDNPDRYALTTLTILPSSGKKNILDADISFNKSESNVPFQFTKQIFHIIAEETLPVGSVLTAITHNRPHTLLPYFISDQALLDTFNINDRGELTLRKKLDFEKEQHYFFKVFATDRISNNTAFINVTVKDVNEWEPRFRYQHYKFEAFLESDSSKMFVGKVEYADGDKNDKVSLTLSGKDAHMFSIDSNGAVYFIPTRIKITDIAKIVTFEAIAVDNGVPPKNGSTTITVHFSSRQNDNLVKAVTEETVLMSSFGGLLILLAIVIIVLMFYIYKGKRQSPIEALPSLGAEKQGDASLTTMLVEKPNPMYAAGSRGQSSPGTSSPPSIASPTASAIGGVLKENHATVAGNFKQGAIMKPKIYPAPQPPVNFGPGRCWANKTDVGIVPSIMENQNENTNLTVYF